MIVKAIDNSIRFLIFILMIFILLTLSIFRLLVQVFFMSFLTFIFLTLEGQSILTVTFKFGTTPNTISGVDSIIVFILLRFK